MALPKSFIDKHNAGVVQGLKDVSDLNYRQDIDVLLNKDKEVFNLFVLALDQLQSSKMSGDIMGYYEMAGIHGMPQRSWDDVGGKKNIDRPAQSGYCAHGNQAFPTWHRPYLAMFEQSVCVQMHAIAEGFNEPHKTKYLAAAKRFRLPYWDYYRPRGGNVTFSGIIDSGRTSFPFDYSCPEVFTRKSIMVRKSPDDRLELLENNPFFSYHFAKNISPDKAIQESSWQAMRLNDPNDFPRDHTVRYPRFNAKFKSSEATLNLVLNSLRMDSNRVARDMIVGDAYSTYPRFATGAIPSATGGKTSTETDARALVRRGASGSLEALHGFYHGMIGGFSLPSTGVSGGHMTMVASAAFDPIFWMHHCQIDRLFALWQAANPNSWFQKLDRDDPNSDDPCLPFRKAPKDSSLAPNKQYWTSDDSRDLSAFGYTYPELGGVGRDARATSEQVKSKVREMYDWSISLVPGQTGFTPPEYMKPVPVLESEFLKLPETSAPKPVLLSKTVSLNQAPEALSTRIKDMTAPAKRPDTSEMYSYEWYIDDQVQRMALNGEFTIYYFIGTENIDAVPPADSEFALAPTIVGLNHIFASPVELCDNCGEQQREDTIVTNTVAITSALLDFVEIGELQDLTPDNVIQLLKKRLRWRVVANYGTIVDPRKLNEENDFKVGISCKKARLPRGTGGEEYMTYPDVINTIIGQASASQDTF